MAKDVAVDEEIIDLDEFCARLNLEILHSDKQREVKVTTYNVNRVGLQLAGFFEHFVFKRVQVLGEMEAAYLEQFNDKQRQKVLDKVFEFEFPCLIITHGLSPSKEILESAKKHNRILLSSKYDTTFFVNELSMYLNEILAKSITLHGVLIDVYGVGMFITGDSGVGKSEIALELVQRNHRLIADDAVVIKRINDGLVGSSPPIIRHFMEVRGVGIVDIKSIYGAGAIRNSKKIEMCVHLEEWGYDKSYDRLGNGISDMDILETKIPKFTIPVRTGRNLAVILEVAARNFRLKTMGYDALNELAERMKNGK